MIEAPATPSPNPGVIPSPGLETAAKVGPVVCPAMMGIPARLVVAEHVQGGIPETAPGNQPASPAVVAAFRGLTDDALEAFAAAGYGAEPWALRAVRKLHPLPEPKPTTPTRRKRRRPVEKIAVAPSEKKLPRKITVMGVELPVNSNQAKISADINGDMNKVPAQIAYWSRVHGSAVREREESDAQYRYWRGQMVGQILDDEPKLAEYKVNARINGDPQFLAIKKGMAQAQRNVEIARGMILAFEKKANILQSRGAALRVEAEKITVQTKGEEKPRKRRSRPRD